MTHTLLIKPATAMAILALSSSVMAEQLATSPYVITKDFLEQTTAYNTGLFVALAHAKKCDMVLKPAVRDTLNKMSQSMMASPEVMSDAFNGLKPTELASPSEIRKAWIDGQQKTFNEAVKVITSANKTEFCEDTSILEERISQYYLMGKSAKIEERFEKIKKAGVKFK